MDIGDDVVAGLTCGINGKFGNETALTAGGGRGEVSDADVVATVGAIVGLYFDSDRGVRSKAPCDMSDGAGDDCGGVWGLFELLSLSTWLLVDGARDRFSTDLLRSASMARIARAWLCWSCRCCSSERPPRRERFWAESPDAEPVLDMFSSQLLASSKSSSMKSSLSPFEDSGPLMPGCMPGI